MSQPPAARRAPDNLDRPVEPVRALLANDAAITRIVIGFQAAGEQLASRRARPWDTPSCNADRLALEAELSASRDHLMANLRDRAGRIVSAGSGLHD